MNLSSIEWSAMGTVLTAVATILLVLATYALFLVTKRLADVSRRMNEAQAIGHLIQLINAGNETVLANADNLLAAEEMFVHEGLDHSLGAVRQRWLAFIWLNQYELMYFMKRRGDLGEFSDFLRVSSDQVLCRLLKNKWVMQMVETRGYHRDFVDFCKEMADESNAPTS